MECNQCSKTVSVSESFSGAEKLKFVIVIGNEKEEKPTDNAVIAEAAPEPDKSDDEDLK